MESTRKISFFRELKTEELTVETPNKGPFCPFSCMRVYTYEAVSTQLHDVVLHVSRYQIVKAPYDLLMLIVTINILVCKLESERLVADRSLIKLSLDS